MVSAVLSSGAALLAPPLAVALSDLAIRRRLAHRLQSVSLDAMSGESWEEVCAELFRRHGFQVQRTPRTADFGADLILVRGQRRTAVECKRWAKPIGVEVVRSLRGAMAYWRCDRGFVLSALSGYTRQARLCAARIGVELYTLERLANDLREPDLLALRRPPARRRSWLRSR